MNVYGVNSNQYAIEENKKKEYSTNVISTQDASVFSASEKNTADTITKTDSFNYNQQSSVTEKTDLKEEFDKVQDEQGFIGKLWNGAKCLFGGGSKKVEESIKKYENGEISYEEAQKSLTKYKDGQDMCVDVVADMASGIIAVGAFALAVPTGGASLAVGLGAATAAGVGIKVGVKAADAAVGGRDYTQKDLIYDSATGAINGLFAPVTNGIGASVTKTVGKKLGLTVVKEGTEEIVEQGVKTGIKSIITTQGVDVLGGTIGKRALAVGTGMAVDGAIGGASDNMVRAALNGDDILEAGVQGAVGGMIMAPIIGGGFKVAGKAGRAINNKITTKSVLPDGVNTTFKQGQTGDCSLLSTIDGLMNNSETQNKIKKSISKTIGGDYNVKIGNRTVQVAKYTLSDEMLSDVTGIKIFEQAYKQVAGDLDGGFADVVAKEFGLNPVHIVSDSITDETLDKLAKEQNNLVLSLGSKIDSDGMISQDGANHYFTIKNIDSSGQKVSLTNPYDTSKSIELSYDDIKKLGISIDGGSIKETSIPNISRQADDIAFRGTEISNNSTVSAVDTDEIYFNPKTGDKINLSEAEQLDIASMVTSDIEQQKLILKMINNESIVVTESAEKHIMKSQFDNLLKEYPDTNIEDIYIYSPRPKGQTKSYTRSGEVFAETNNINKTHIKTDFKDIPQNSTVIMADDCSITGASMVFDLLEHLPEDFQGKVLLAPTVKGSGKDMADKVLDLFSKINSKDSNRGQIVENLNNLISDGKKTNTNMLNKLLISENYNGTSIDIAKGSLNAPNFRETQTFASLNKTEQRLVDALFTADGLNKGYHSSGVMVLMPGKTPNNNVGIMDLFGDALNLKSKPNGILRYRTNIELINNNQKPALGLFAASNNHGNYSKIIGELPDRGKSIIIPYDSKTEGPLDIVIRFSNGETKTIKYQAKLENQEALTSERLFGFEIDESLKDSLRALKGEYKPKSVKKIYGYYADVLAIPKDAEIVSIGSKKLEELINK